MSRPTFDPDFREVGEPIVTLRMGKVDAETLRDALADFLCWSRGFIAACPDDTARHPMGLSTACDFNIKLKRAIDAAEAKGENNG